MQFVSNGTGPAQPTKPIKKIIHNGIPYFSVPDAARFLGTTATKVREMMGNGSLEWAQFKENGKLFITGNSLADKQRSMTTTK
jgi:hypothetical protein